MEPPERPQSIRSAVALMYFGAGLTIFSTIVFFATKGQLPDALADAVPDVDKATRVAATVLGLTYLVSLAFTISFIATIPRDERIGSFVDYTVPYIVVGCVVGLLAW